MVDSRKKVKDTPFPHPTPLLHSPLLPTPPIPASTLPYSLLNHLTHRFEDICGLTMSSSKELLKVLKAWCSSKARVMRL